MGLTGNSNTLSFTYNADGIRTSKTVNYVKHEYMLDGNRIIAETWGDNLMLYLYDQSGAPLGLAIGGSGTGLNMYDYFFFDKNLQGDITAVYNQSGTKIGTYTYDAWGNHTITPEASISALENNVLTIYNPFRYRSYFYDVETGLYYLQSRYYNPEWGRFLNADGISYLGVTGTLLGFNQYSYCENNPIMHFDPTGHVTVTNSIGIDATAFFGFVFSIGISYDHH